MPMNVKQLRKALEGLPDDMPVILQKDAEGNGFRYLAGADGVNQGYDRGELQPITLTQEMADAGYSDGDTNPNGTPCVVLWPV